MSTFNRTAIVVSAIACLAGTLAAESYSPLFAPGSTHREVWVCADQYNRPIPYAYFTVATGYYAYTNAHYHEDPWHVFSTATPYAGYAGSSGEFGFDLTTTLVAQAEFLLMSCSNEFGTVYAVADFAVGYNDLYYTHHDGIWHKIGGTDTGKDTGHGTTDYNRYLRTDAAFGIYYATLAYLAATGQQKVCTNDMALWLGGKFDINALKGAPWRSPHAAHDRGTAVDVAGPGSGQCSVSYQVNPNIFKQYCVANGALEPNSVAHSDHAHCNWANPATYPH
jgi:hypothetical protein